MGKQRFPQFSEREFLATIQNGGGRWGLSHSGRHKQLSFSRPQPALPPASASSAVLPPPPAKPFRGIAWDWLIGWGGGVCAPDKASSLPVVGSRFLSLLGNNGGDNGCLSNVSRAGAGLEAGLNQRLIGGGPESGDKRGAQEPRRRRRPYRPTRIPTSKTE